VLTVGLAVSAAVSFIAQAQAQSTVEEVLVTGSYIKGTASDGASPVEVVSQEDISNSGDFDMRGLATRFKNSPPVRPMRAATARSSEGLGP
jgi:outer membrane cobalamin receptor